MTEIELHQKWAKEKIFSGQKGEALHEIQAIVEIAQGKGRLERIATACLQGILSGPLCNTRDAAMLALQEAHQLIKKLDEVDV